MLIPLPLMCGASGVSLLAVVCGSALFGSKNVNEDAEYWRLVGEVVDSPLHHPGGLTADAKTCLRLA